MSDSTAASTPKPKRQWRVLRGLGVFVCWFVLFILVVWATAAIYFDFNVPSLRTPLAILFVAAMLLAFIFVKNRLRSMGVFVGGFLLVLAWWFTLKPSNERPWQQDVAQTAFAEINGDEITLHNVRNCDYATETNYTVRWETRKVRLSQLTGVDIALTYWGSPWMAHPIVSFQFADSLPVCFSIETRKEIGEGYSAVRGLFRQFELVYVVADERDVIRLRTNYRQGEDVYLYHIKLTPEQSRERFMDYLQRINQLHAAPAWYNAVTANCTTSIRAQHNTQRRAPWDWRMLLNGKSDEMMYERGGLIGDLPFAQLKQRSHINAAARLADKSPAFSGLVRETTPVTTR